ncbi:amidase/aspartyl-tRNA(Asn)/glutamyl-tRNA(Gln) amidotransferase subunit A [Bradyrhizobium brasilense]|uniref:Indoleacetamide hydrolase n=2 Tax=Bradyrhizobium brasilense TaxID=1419277 RepID=A0A1G7Q6N9_9BRAD|nr:amidase/aspartyl-tRNA(Asn)/glutamyl-tRNA(Gln) amidotransferase subunit A [Bradyrhizobium brasilense]
MVGASEALAKGEVTSVELTGIVLKNVEQRNSRIRAVTHFSEDLALAAAQAADACRGVHGMRSGVDGIPFVIKECIDTADTVCSSGLPFLRDRVGSRDADVVKRLRDAGAVILGVCAADPGMFEPRSPAVTHPQAPDLTVGGSSGGSAAALAGGLALGSLGTDTGGSIRIPSACCLTAGLKPTYGRVSARGCMPLSPSADHIGPMALNAADLPAIAAVIDPGFALTTRRPPGAPLRIGHAPAYWRDAAPETRAGIKAALDIARDLGGLIREVQLPDPDEVLEFHASIFVAEAAAFYFKEFPEHLEDCGPTAQIVFDMARRQKAYEFVQACARREEARRAVDATFEDVDFLIVPTLAVAPPARDATVVSIAGAERDFVSALVRYTALFNQTGHPVVSLPVNVVGPGMGASAQIAGARNCDRDVVAFAATLERELALNFDRVLRI